MTSFFPVVDIRIYGDANTMGFCAAFFTGINFSNNSANLMFLNYIAVIT